MYIFHRFSLPLSYAILIETNSLFWFCNRFLDSPPTFHLRHVGVLNRICIGDAGFFLKIILHDMAHLYTHVEINPCILFSDSAPTLHLLLRLRWHGSDLRRPLDDLFRPISGLEQNTRYHGDLSLLGHLCSWARFSRLCGKDMPSPCDVSV